MKSFVWQIFYKTFQIKQCMEIDRGDIHIFWFEIAHTAICLRV